MKSIKLLFIALASSLLTVSCLVDDDKSQLETDFASTPYTVGFKNSSSTTSFLTDGSTQVFKQPINLIAGAAFANTPAIDVTFEVDASSTAVAGTDYDFVSSTQSTTIEASRDFGTIDISVYTDQIEVLNPKTIVLRLLTTSNGIIGDNGTQAGEFQTVTIYLGGICFSDVAGTFDIVSVASGGYTTNIFGEVITQIGEGTYSTLSTGEFATVDYDLTAAPNFAPTNGFIFTENCGIITIESQPLADAFGGNPVSGSGTVDSSGNMVMNITVGNYDSFTVTYTKL